MSQFLKQTFASLIGTLAGLFLFLAMGTTGLFLLFILAISQKEEPTIKDKSVLVIDLSTQINDTKPPSRLAKVLAEDRTSITLRQVLDALEKARQDKRIVGIFLDGRKDETENGYANLKEVRAALERFRAAGKPIIAYDLNSSEKEYYLSSVANTLVLNPMGIMEFNGFSSQPIFLTGALEKYGIGVQVVRVGNYKSAVEPFTRKDFSPENRQQTEALIEDLWADFLSQVGQSRKLTPQKLQAIADNQGTLMGEEAMAAGLVDRVGYLDEVIDEFKQLTNSDKEDKSFRQVQLATYIDIPLENSEERSSKNKIAVVYAEGEIIPGEGDVDKVSSDRFAKVLGQLREDEDVKAVVLRLNSPGGSATASDVILREVELIRTAKPTIVSMGNVAASGAYWIATGADYIFAETNTITGSIGVFGLLPNIKKIANENGITWDIIKTGRLADLTTITRPKTAQELAILQKYTSQTYKLFLEKVAKSRNLSPEKVAQIAQGRVWSGKDAQEIGLVDSLGGLEAAIKYAAEKANLGEDWEIAEYPEQRSWETEILGRLVNGSEAKSAQKPDALTAEFLKLKEDLTILQTLNDPLGIYTRLPFNLRIE